MMPENPSQELQITQARSMQIPKRWPLVNTVTSRDGSFTKDARLINAYAEKDKVTGDYNIEKRPGFSPTPIITGTGPGRGLFTYEYVILNTLAIPHRLIVQYLTVYVTGNPGGVSAYATITTEAGFTSPPIFIGPVLLNRGNRFQFLGIATNPPGVLFGGDNTTALTSTAYFYDGVTFTGLLGGDPSGFPNNTVPGFVYLNGYAYVMDYSGKIWQTVNQNQVTGGSSWDTGLDFIQAASDSDIAVQLARQLIYVVAIKTWTTQFYYDAGNPVGSSLSPVPGALYNFGCISADTFCDLDGTLLWATNSKVGTYRIVMIENLNAKFVSTPAVERQLDLGRNSSWYSLAYQHSGHRWYAITNVTTNVTMVYDITEELWYLWTDYQGNYYPVAGRGGPGVEWHQMIATGNIYLLGGDYVYPNDYGNLVPVDIYTPNFDAGVDRIKMLSQMRVNADQTPGSYLKVRYSDNDYKSWTNFREINLGQSRPLMNDEGSFYRRAYHLRHYSNTGLRIRSLDLQMDIGQL
jgi:hypothetical protein